ncbi:MAG: hypothetical protein D6694_14995 [Gammaproteobacteria bacterium]|nr:MAG: hypothetical protein D6694_14995 [Gammaproteobacteria bacterium]
MGGGSYVQVSPGERAMADLAMQQWMDYKKRFQPLEKKFVKELTSEKYRRGIKLGQANAGASQAVDKTLASQRTNAFAAGINPNSGKFAAMTKSGARGAAIGKTVAGMSNQIKADRVSNLGNAIQVGRGIKSIGTAGYKDSARLGLSQAAATAELNNFQDNALGNVAGTAIGTYMALGAPGLSFPANSGVSGNDLSGSYQEGYNGPGIKKFQGYGYGIPGV